MKIANYTACSGPEAFAEYVRAATGDFLLVSENSAAISKVVQRGLRVCVMLAGVGKRRNVSRLRNIQSRDGVLLAASRRVYASEDFITPFTVCLNAPNSLAQ